MARLTADTWRWLLLVLRTAEGREESTGITGLAGGWQACVFPGPDAQAIALRACPVSNRRPGGAAWRSPHAHR